MKFNILNFIEKQVSSIEEFNNNFYQRQWILTEKNIEFFPNTL